MVTGVTAKEACPLLPLIATPAFANPMVVATSLRQVTTALATGTLWASVTRMTTGFGAATLMVELCPPPEMMLNCATAVAACDVLARVSADLPAEVAGTRRIGE